MSSKHLHLFFYLVCSVEAWYAISRDPRTTKPRTDLMSMGSAANTAHAIDAKAQGEKERTAAQLEN